MESYFSEKLEEDILECEEVFGVEITVDSKITGQRLDVLCASEFQDKISSRSYVQKLIETGNISVNNKQTKANYKVKTGDKISFIPPKLQEVTILPEDITIDIVYEDSDILVINKARGMVVHPAPGNYSGTLVNALLYYCKDLSDINGIIRPGIVHRIDKDTTGLLVVAKNNAAHIFLSEQLKNHDIKREYIAVAEGIIKENSGTVKLPIGRHPIDRKKMAVRSENSKEAITHFSVVKRLQGHTLVVCNLETGRTHQIRVHLSHIGYPIVGDPLYGYRDTHGITGQALHARKLTFTHPSTKEVVSFEAEPPADFSELVNGLSESVSFTM